MPAQTAKLSPADIERLDTDILILGAGGAGLLAALHAHDANPDLDIAVVAKGLIGKSGCTRMVQGGYNVAVSPGDSVERHFMDTIKGGSWINNQDLAWILATGAVERIHELENRFGCFFDRNPDGTIHQKAFAGQTFDRTVHKGDLTGIEIMNRLSEQVWARNIHRLEEHRACALIRSADGPDVAGALLLDMRDGRFRMVCARAVLLATGAGPTMYRYHTPSGDKSCDGLAMALRFGLPVRDMEMVQFHPTGLIAGPDTRITGTIIEEGLRGAGGHILDGAGVRFMPEYDDRAERATRDIVSRAMFERIRSGPAGPNGGVFFTMSHLDPKTVRTEFKGMVERCADIGLDLVGGQVEVVPTAHYLMGGVVIDPTCQTETPGLFAAGEDSGGVHGANRLGGNGVANSTVFGGIAGDRMAAVVDSRSVSEPRATDIDAAITAALAPFDRPPGDLNQIREDLHDLMWECAGIVRSANSLNDAAQGLTVLNDQLDEIGLAEHDRRFNMGWQDFLNIENLILVSRAVVRAAKARENSCGAHYRSDFPHPAEPDEAAYTVARADGPEIAIDMIPVAFTRVQPDQSLVADAAG